jgi:hypothetical protein
MTQDELLYQDIDRLISHLEMVKARSNSFDDASVVVLREVCAYTTEVIRIAASDNGLDFRLPK